MVLTKLMKIDLNVKTVTGKVPDRLLTNDTYWGIMEKSVVGLIFLNILFNGPGGRGEQLVWVFMFFT